MFLELRVICVTHHRHTCVRSFRRIFYALSILTVIWGIGLALLFCRILIGSLTLWNTPFETFHFSLVKIEVRPRLAQVSVAGKNCDFDAGYHTEKWKDQPWALSPAKPLSCIVALSICQAHSRKIDFALFGFGVTAWKAQVKLWDWVLSFATSEKDFRLSKWLGANLTTDFWQPQ